VRILLTGANGQVGWELQRSLAPLGEVIALDRSQLDLARADELRGRVRAIAPALIVNAGAYTAVDRAESEPGLARAINAIAPGVLAEEAHRLDAVLVHYSTDYVFDGTKAAPYTETDAPNPSSVYGRTKLEGERRVLAAQPEAIVVRTAWVFGPGRNFVRTILEAAARTKRGEAPALRVADDQRGSPTYAGDLADGIIGLVDADASGVVHLTNRGVATWWDLARAAVDIWGHPELPIEKVRTADVPRPAPRPAWSVLDTSRAEHLGVRLRPWREALRGYLDSDASPLRELGA